MYVLKLLVNIYQLFPEFLQAVCQFDATTLKRVWIKHFSFKKIAQLVGFAGQGPPSGAFFLKALRA
jgi:DNA-binding transcriptional regulator of glucitol operon